MSSQSRLLLLSDSAGPPTTLPGGFARTHLIDASVPGPIHPVVLACAQASLGRILGQLGADAVDSRAWSSLPPTSHLSALRGALDALADPQFDAIVVDCGSLSRARELVEAPSILLRLLDAALTPRLAMWRFAGESEGDSTVFEALSAARNELLRMQKALSHPDTLMRLVTGSGDDSRERDAADKLGLLGVATEVWTETECVHRAEPLSADAIVVEQIGDDYRLDLPLSGSAATRSRVGRREDDLVLTVDDVYRWVPLPSVLLRCRAVDATRTAEGLSVRFTPDPARWRRPSETAV